MRFDEADRPTILATLDCWAADVDLNYRAYFTAIVPEMLDEISRLRALLNGTAA